MKKAILFFILNACGILVFAQNPVVEPTPVKNRNMGLEFSAGYSVALGTYASFDKQNDKSGYATNGWQLQVTFDWMGKKNLGLAIQYTFQRNPMKNLANEVFPGGLPDSLSSGAWANHYLLIGPVFMKKIKRLHLDAKVLAGVIVSSSQNFSTPNPYDSTRMKSDENLGAGFAYQVSAGIGYVLSPNFTVKFNLNLLGGWPAKNKQYGSRFIGYVNYKDPETGLWYSKAVYSAPVTYEIKKVVTTLNPSLGVVYTF
jgi:hypothetical protein